MLFSALLRSLNSKLAGIAHQQSIVIYLIVRCLVPVLQASRRLLLIKYYDISDRALPGFYITS